MKVVLVVSLFMAIASASFVASKLHRAEVPELKNFNAADFTTGVLIAMRFLEKVPDAEVCTDNVGGVKNSLASAK